MDDTLTPVNETTADKPEFDTPVSNDMTVDEIPGPLFVPKYLISPRTVAVIAAIFGIGCLAALSVVTAVEGDDALSTVAIALAVLAFVIQILVFIAQSQSSNLQMLRSEQLNTQTRSLLSEMQATTRSTERMVREQFGQLLSAFMDAAKNAQSGKDGFDPDAFEQRLIANIRREQSRPQRAQDGSTGASQAPAGRTPARARRRPSRTFDAGPFPSEEEAQPVLDDLRSLSQPARSRLLYFARDKENASRSDVYEGLPLSDEFSQVDGELSDRGFLGIARVPDSPFDIVNQLTDKGVLASRVVGASGPVPEWARDVFT